jgi:hypothetical protein
VSLDVAIGLLKNGDGKTAKPIDIALMSLLAGRDCDLRSMVAVERLVAAGASLGTKDSKRLTPWQKGQTIGHFEILARLDGTP